MRRLFFHLVFAFAVVQAALLASGCSGGDDEPAAEPDSAERGTFSLPLIAEAGGHTYRLQGELYLSGPWSGYLGLNADEEQVTVSLPGGGYYAYLYWPSLTRDDGFGNSLPVDARLVSANGFNFDIFNQTTTTISFQFETDGQIVTVGTGRLNVSFEVDETTPVCTLLGGDCEEGTWCAPSELTGNALGCIEAGPVAEGDACSSPRDCTANTSCFDFGGGAVCTRLCLNNEFGEACSTDSTCTAQGVDYGVCAPNP